MMTTSLALIALVASANSSAQLSWEADYAKAFHKAVEQHRPLAVFIGNGQAGPAQIVKDGVAESTTKLLAESYVVVYIDTATTAGKTLAASYGMNQGLIIGDRAGDKQALRLTGLVAAADLNTSLVRFADPKMVVTQTATSPNAVAAPVYAHTASYSPAPSYNNYAPIPNYGGYAPMSPCASGRCPTAR